MESGVGSGAGLPPQVGENTGPPLNPELEVELPPDCEEGDGTALSDPIGFQAESEELPSDDDVELPPNVDSDGGLDDRKVCTCHRGCPYKFDESHIDSLRAVEEGKKEADHLNDLFAKVRHQVQTPEGKVCKLVTWRFQGQIVCKSFWCHAMGIRRSTL